MIKAEHVFQKMFIVGCVYVGLTMIMTTTAIVIYSMYGKQLFTG